MLRNVTRLRLAHGFNLFTSSPRLRPSSRLISSSSDSGDRRDEELYREDLNQIGLFFDDIDPIMSEQFEAHRAYPNLDVTTSEISRPIEGHNVVVIQPWVNYNSYPEYTEPELQLQECVSLGNTIRNWKVVGKNIMFTKHMNRKHLVGPKTFEELNKLVHSYPSATAVFFGVEILSGVQLSNLERDLKMAVYDRFTVVLNIFRQHARSKQAKIQLALAELPYIRSHLRQIHESSEYSSSTGSLKLLLGGTGEKHYHMRLNILRKREKTLKKMLAEIRKQRELEKRHRRKSLVPMVSVVGYTNSGKTTLIKYLTADDSIQPKDQLFATLDVTVHRGALPSFKDVLYIDTVGFLSRIPIHLVEAFSATLKDVSESHLILHVLDISHPDSRMQYHTVMNALKSLEIPQELIKTKLTVGNKFDLLADREIPLDKLPKCDLRISATNNINMQEFVGKINHQLAINLPPYTLERLGISNPP